MTHYFLLASVILLLAGGQILFKITATNLVKDSGLLMLFTSALNFQMILALFLYGIGTCLWVYALSIMPLNRAYPFISLTFVIVPVLSWFFLGEKISWGYVAGIAAIITGVVIISLQPQQ